MSRDQNSSIDPFIQLLRRERLAQKLSFYSLADKSGYAYQALMSWEHGRRSPRFRCFIDWANALGYDVTLTKRQDENH